MTCGNGDLCDPRCPLPIRTISVIFNPVKLLIEPRSGSYQGLTFSRNRFGQYLRSRATPVNPNTAAQAAQRSRQSVNAAAWRALTGTQRAGWNDLGVSMTRTDSLGQTYALTGFQAYVSVNNNLAFAGTALISDAPALATPAGLLTGTLTGTTSTLSLAYTATPLATGVKLLVSASPQRSAGRSFEQDFRYIFTSSAAAASPANIFTAYQTKFGTPVTGNRIFVSATCTIGGFESPAFITSVVI